ncbi:hypothetical protein J6590_105595 [Homalodisca vitripennis]|nr:hypothetical protein J6590_105595 [Homalodisca vitripennis]
MFCILENINVPRDLDETVVQRRGGVWDGAEEAGARDLPPALKSQGPFPHRGSTPRVLQSMVSAVPKTAENNLPGPSGKFTTLIQTKQTWHTDPLLLQDNQRADVQQFPPFHHTFYIAEPPEGCRLCVDDL